MIKAAPDKSVLVIMLNFNSKIMRDTHEVYDVPTETTTVFDDFVTPHGYRKEGTYGVY